MGGRYLYTSVFSASFGAFLAATVTAWSSPMVEKLRKLDDNPLGRPITSSEDSWLASIAILGVCFGCLVISITGSMFGRKPLLIVQGCVVLIFYLLMAWSKTIWLLYIGRFMTGEGVGAIFSILPMYYGEVAEPKNRGLINTTMVIFMNIGMVCTSAAGPYFSFLWFHLCLAGFAVLFIVLVFIFTPESPYVLIKSNRYEAENVLKKLRGAVNVDQSLNEIEVNLSLRSKSHASFLDIFKTRGAIKSFIIGIGGFTFMQLTGTSIVIAYTQTILKEAGGSIPPEQGPIIIQSVQLVVSVLVSLFVDRFSRRLLLSISHFGISLSLIPMALYFSLKRDGYDGIHSISWVPLVCLIIFSIMFSIGVGPILFTFLSELFPSKIKSVMVSAMMCYNMGGSFLLTLLFNDLKDAIGFDILLWIFAVSGFFAVIFVNKVMIETRGKTLDEIQTSLHS